MEILSPEPPKQLEIAIESETESTPTVSKARPKSKKKVRKKNSDKNETIVDDSDLCEMVEMTKKNDATLDELKARYVALKEETQILRKENAEGFYNLRHLIGQRGERILEAMYFNDFPHLAEIEEPKTPAELIEIEDELENEINENLEINPDSIFYQTELGDESGTRPVSESSFATTRIPSEVASQIEKGMRAGEEQNFIKRNIELAKTGDGLTIDERERLEMILANEDDDEG